MRIKVAALSKAARAQIEAKTGTKVTHIGRLKPLTKQDRSREKEFPLHCEARGLPPSELQFKLPRPDAPGHFWVFDCVFPRHKVIIEIDGGIWIRGAHGHPLDILRNMSKQNDAQLAGYAILRFTPQQVKTGEAANTTEKLLRKRGWLP